MHGTPCSRRTAGKEDRTPVLPKKTIKMKIKYKMQNDDKNKWERIGHRRYSKSPRHVLILKNDGRPRNLVPQLRMGKLGLGYHKKKIKNGKTGDDHFAPHPPKQVPHMHKKKKTDEPKINVT
ncbi:hypothetical protein PGB90_000132 [Kerria lacca]